MEFQFVINMIFSVIGGLAIFLLGMNNMSEGMQVIAGSRLRKMINTVTDNRLLACGTGAAVTALIQSSSVTTVMTVGFVNAGVMTLIQAIGVILGADIGTTITGWIVSLNIAEYGLPILGISGFFFLFTKNERLRYIALMVMGFGMIFFGLQLMKQGLEPMRDSEEFIAWFSKYQPDTYLGVVKCILVGAFVTAIVQSSSATVAITITLASTGVIDYNTAVSLVLGENIGTTITAYLASIGASTNAKRVAYAHIIIKVIGVLLITLLFFTYMDLLNSILSENIDIKKRIAFSHTLFNIILIFLFLPFRNHLAFLLQKIIPDRPHKEIPHLTLLDIRMLDTPVLVVEQSHREIMRMGENVRQMLEYLREIIHDNKADDNLIKKVFHREEVLDIIQKEISTFLVNILSGNIPHKLVDEAQAQFRMTDEYESVSDYIASILKLYLKLRNEEIKLTDHQIEELLEIHEMVTSFFKMVDNAIAERKSQIIPKVRSEANAITHCFREKRINHLQKISETKMDPLLSITYINMLNSYRRIRDHILNIAEALAGEKWPFYSEHRPVIISDNY